MDNKRTERDVASPESLEGEKMMTFIVSAPDNGVNTVTELLPAKYKFKKKVITVSQT